MKTTIIARYQDGTSNGQLLFFVDHRYMSPDELLREMKKAIGLWGETEEGRDAWNDVEGDFDWAAVDSHIDNIPWPLGIRSIRAEAWRDNSIVVEHDENLMPGIEGMEMLE